MNNDRCPSTTAGCPKDRKMGASTIAAMLSIMITGIISLIIIHMYGVHATLHFSRNNIYQLHLQKMQELKASFVHSSRTRPRIPMRSLQQAPVPSPVVSSKVYHVTSYGADPTGKRDSTDAILGAISDALKGPGKGFLFQGIVNLGGARVDLEGGNYLISRPLRFPVAAKGNIRYSYLGYRITAGADPSERAFSGTGIVLNGNDNSVLDVVIFSAATGILITGQANLLSGVHCYNKATGFGGTGIYVKAPGLTQTRIVNSYMDYTGIVAEDPVQLTVSNTFFLGDAYIVLKSVKGVVNGVNIVDNMFSGSDKGIDIVRLDQTNGPFKQVDQVVIVNNNALGMKVKTTVARATVQGNTSSWTADFNSMLVFPNLIKQVQYTFITDGTSFPNHVVRNVSGNRVVIQSDVVVPASIYITADQRGTSF